MDQQAMLQAAQQIQSDPAAVQQLQVEIQKLQMHSALKQQINAIHRKCFPKCFEAEVTIDRASPAQERCLVKCGKELLQVNQLVKAEMDAMVQKQQERRYSHY